MGWIAARIHGRVDFRHQSGTRAADRDPRRLFLGAGTLPMCAHDRYVEQGELVSAARDIISKTRMKTPLSHHRRPRL
jgi:hypothetical protein